jgi:hypothetical protein
LRHRSKAKIAKVLGAFEEHLLGDGDSVVLEEVCAALKSLSSFFRTFFNLTLSSVRKQKLI